MAGKVSALCLAGLLLVGCTKREPVPPAGAASILRLSQRNEPADLDPAMATLPDEIAILRALSEGLLVPGPNGTAPLPGAAERFELSPDQLTYTFHLRPDGRWSNGEPVTAQDFVASYRRVLTPATAAPKASVFSAVKNARAFLRGEITDFSAVGIRAGDARTLVITLAQPMPRFPYYVASGPWIPVNPRTVAQHGRAWTKPGNFVGNGPFTLAEWRPHQHLIVRRNPGWRGAAQVKLAEIRFVHLDNGDAEDRAFRAGQVEATMSVPASKLEPYARERAAELHRVPMIETRFLSLNCTRPPLNDARVRRALALAIDRQRIVDFVLKGGQPVATRFVPAALRGATPEKPQAWEQGFAAEEARRLLAEAGFTGGQKFPALELTGWTNAPVLEAVQAMWKKELGIDIRISLRDAKVHFAALMAGTYDLGFMTSIPDVADPENMLTDFVSGAAENLPHWSDARFDALLEEARTQAAPATRATMLTAAEARLVESAAVLPLYFNTKIWLMSPRVHGWQEDGLWTRRFEGITLDEK
ncbi:MAG TPA: peptide ABC transporter substrate-binding protein [Opitutaceae bacterium]|nr:peptide ABC transporter substrate-binding protein [Opitutaceae bacterium]